MKTALPCLCGPVSRALARPLHSITQGLLKFAEMPGTRGMESGPVGMTVRWRVPAGEAQSITATLQSLMLQTRAAAGCAGCTLSTEMGALVVIHYIESWKTETDLRHQVRSNRFSTLAELIEHATEHPSIEFTLPGGPRGLDYAEEVRRF